MKTNIVSSRKQRNVTTYVTASLLMLLPCVALSQEAKAPAEPAQIDKEDSLEAIVLKKLSTIIIPAIDFEGVSIEEAFDFMRTRARELDLNEKDPANRGIGFVIRKPQAARGAQGAAVEEKAVVISELQLHNVSLLSALKYTCLLTNTRFSIENGIIISPKKEGDKELAIPVDQAAKAALQNKLNTVMIPKIDFENVTIDEALEYLRVRFTEFDPDKKHLNLVLVKPLGNEVPEIAEMQLKNVSVATYLKQICEATNLEYTVDDAAVILTPKKK